MNDFIKLIEICTKSMGYSKDHRDVLREFTLREIIINKNHIVGFRENAGLKLLLDKKELNIKNLNPHTSFTKIILNTGSNTTLNLDVVGEPSYVVKKIKESL